MFNCASTSNINLKTFSAMSMVNATHLKVHRTAASLKKGDLPSGTLGGRREGSAVSCMPFAMTVEDR
jgi:hypothetical protein